MFLTDSILGSITCAAYPLSQIDTIDVETGQISRTSALNLVVFGDKDEHLELMDGVLIDLLNAKWNTFVKFKFYRQFFTFVLYFLLSTMCFTLRPGPPSHRSLNITNITNTTIHTKLSRFNVSLMVLANLTYNINQNQSTTTIRKKNTVLRPETCVNCPVSFFKWTVLKVTRTTWRSGGIVWPSSAGWWTLTVRSQSWGFSGKSRWSSGLLFIWLRLFVKPDSWGRGCSSRTWFEQNDSVLAETKLVMFWCSRWLCHRGWCSSFPATWCSSYRCFGFFAQMKLKIWSRWRLC